MITKSKRIIEPWPENLEQAIDKLQDFASARLVNELYEISLPLLKKYGIYLPLIQYKAELGFAFTKDAGVGILFKRHWSHGGWDEIQGLIFTPEKKYGVEATRRLERKKMVPAWYRKFNINSQGEMKNYIEKDLIY